MDSVRRQKPFVKTENCLSRDWLGKSDILVPAIHRTRASPHPSQNKRSRGRALRPRPLLSCAGMPGSPSPLREADIF